MSIGSRRGFLLLGRRLRRVFRRPPRLHHLRQALPASRGQSAFLCHFLRDGHFTCLLSRPVPTHGLDLPLSAVPSSVRCLGGTRLLRCTAAPLQRLFSADLTKGVQGAVDGVAMLFEVCDDTAQIIRQVYSPALKHSRFGLFWAKLLPVLGIEDGDNNQDNRDYGGRTRTTRRVTPLARDRPGGPGCVQCGLLTWRKRRRALTPNRVCQPSSAAGADRRL
jgi:hypothetical protein